MKILALEFSTAQRSVAVGQVSLPGSPPQAPPSSTSDFGLRTSDFSSGWWEVVETGPGGMRAFEMIERALAGAGMQRRQLECLAIGIGPGSYTGIRAAIAIAQGWQQATGAKLLPISSVECLAAQAQAQGFVGRADFVIDAQRKEFYLAGYDIKEGRIIETLSLRLAQPADVENRANEREALFGPEARRWFPEARELFPRAETLGRLAGTKTEFTPGEKIEPIYLRETTFVKAPKPRSLGGVGG